MSYGGAGPGEESVLWVGTFRVPDVSTARNSEFRALAVPLSGECRWIGRRLLDYPEGEEIVVVSLRPDVGEPDPEVTAGHVRLGDDLGAATRTATETYRCRAHGAWERTRRPAVVRLFRGSVVEGDPDRFDSRSAELYLANFEANASCVAIAAGVRGKDVMLATLWTDWDAIVTATDGDLRQVLPIRLPGWAVAGGAVHYEVVAVQHRLGPGLAVRGAAVP